MKRVVLKLAAVLRDIFLEFLIVFLILHTSVFNVIDIVPRLYQIDVRVIKDNLNRLIGLIDDLLISDCYAQDFPPPDKAVFGSLKGGSLSQSFQADLFTGKASFIYPIDVPSGRKGIQSNLNLIYSSQSNNDWCGVGWTLDLGSIYRSTKRGIPKYDNSDTFIFSINGSESELVNIGSNEYRTKIESEFMRFYFNGSYWEITDKTGIKYRLGYNSDSKVTNVKGTYKWCLDKVIDVFGNYRIISYSQDQGQIYLLQIRYTGNENTGDALHCTVDLVLESRQDIPPNYRTGDRVVIAYRLKEIQTKVDGSLVKKYILNYIYSNDSKRSLLSSIIQYGSDGTTSLPPTTFSYKENGYTITSGSNWISGFGNGKIAVSGDPNGDGLTDGLIYNPSTLYWEVAISNESNFELKSSFNFYSNIPHHGFPFTGDFNGDGLTDVGVGCIYQWTIPPYDPYGTPMTTTSIKIDLSDGSKFNDVGIWYSIQSGAYLTRLSGVGDFNGDGLDDILIVIPQTQRAYVLLSNGSSFIISSIYQLGTSSVPFVNDFNGDGLADIGTLDTNGNWRIFFNNGASFESPRTWITNFGAAKTPIPVDFNGDGLTDAGVFDKDTGQWQVAISDGTKFIPSGDWINNFGSGKLPLAGDYNGNGIVGPGFFDSSSGTWQIADIQGTPNDLLVQINNGIGGSTVINYAPSAPNTNLPFILQTVKSVTINDGLGNSYSTNYQYSDGLYDREDREFRGFNYVKVTDAEGNYTETYFKQDDIYKGRPYLQQTKDAQGELYTKSETTWNYTQPYTGAYFSYIAQTDNYIYDGDTTYKQTRARFEYDTYGNPIKAISDGDVELTGDEKTQVTEYIYNTDKWLLAFPKYVYLLNAQGAKVSQKWFYYDNVVALDTPPAQGLLTKEEVLVENPITQQSYKVAAQLSYDAYGNLKGTIDALGRTTTTTYETDLNTYPIKVINALGHTVQSTYDYRTGQILTSTDPNNQVTRNIYDTLGRLIKVIGPNDTESYPAFSYEYQLSTFPVKITKRVKTDYAAVPNYLVSYEFFDGLGRLIQSKSPTELEPQTGTERQIISGATVFDARAQVKEQYLPYFAVASPDYVAPNYSTAYTSFIYEPLGRLIQLTNPDSTYSTISYSDWQKTITDENGHYKSEYYDAYDRLVKVEEHNQGETYTFTYEYDIQNNLAKVIDNQNNIIQIWYDSLGRKIKIDDPNMGIWLYEYDKVGNLIKQTDAKAQLLFFDYDALSRLTRKYTNTQTLATYLYDDLVKGNCIGRLSKIIDLSGSTEFFYDNLGREIKSTKTVTGSDSYTVERSYDALDRLLTLKYPDGEVVTYAYNSQGIETVNGTRLTVNETYISSIDYSATGQITKVTYGNGVETNYTYDPNTLRLSSLISQSAKGKIQDLSYQFDSVGNIKQIADYVNTATQNFLYDDLDRLAQAQGAYGSFGYTYDSIGNMLHKEGADLTYGKNGKLPHAVTAYTLNTTCYTLEYDANGNMIFKGPSIQGGLFFTYDIENRLRKIEDTTSQSQITASMVLKPGWNFLSFSILPADKSISNVLSSISGKYDQVSRYNAQTQSFEHYVGNSKYDQFTTLDYHIGYQIYITAQEDIMLNITGTFVSEKDIPLKAGWNLIGGPYCSQNVITALKDIAFSQLFYYNKDTQAFEEYPTFTALEPGKTYYLKVSQDQTRTVNNTLATTEFTYDGDGGRVKKTVATSEGQQVATYIGSLFEKNSSGKTTKHIFAGANRIASIEQQASNSQIYYYHSDHLGSSNVISDVNGNQVGFTEFTPYGLISRQTGTYDPKYKFTGKELDSTTGLYYYGARYYDPTIGRFITADSIVQSPYDPQSLNRYSYCRNNPINYIDPSGHFWFIPLIIAVVKGAIIGAAIGAASAAIMGGDIGKGALFGAIGGGVFAGFSGLAQTAMRFVTIPGGIGPMTAGATSASNIFSAVVGGAASGAAVTGINGGDIGKGALIGGAVAGTFAVISETASLMRAKGVEQSRLDPRNSSGKSVGNKGDGFKLAGGRYDPDPNAWPSPLGGVQGGQGKIFGFNYPPGSIPDRVFEAYAGPHDFLNSWSYDSVGNLRNLNSVEKFIGTFTNPLNVVLATPIVATSAIPSAVYSAPAIIYGESHGDDNR